MEVGATSAIFGAGVLPLRESFQISLFLARRQSYRPISLASVCRTNGHLFSMTWLGNATKVSVAIAFHTLL
jgi:hypothetical protein